MPEFGIIGGDLDNTVYVRLRDATTGLAKTGLVFDSAGASCSYTLPRATAVPVALVTQTPNGAHDPGGFCAVSDTIAKGLYRLDLPDASVPSGRFSVVSIEFDGVIEESSLLPLVAAVAAARADTPIVAGLLSLFEGDARLGVVKTKLFWDFTDLTGSTDLSTGSTGLLEFHKKYENLGLVTSIAITDTDITSLGSDQYRATFAVSKAVADLLIRGDRLTYRVSVAHTASSMESVLEAGDVAVS